jgi:hypothetical protein
MNQYSEPLALLDGNVARTTNQLDGRREKIAELNNKKYKEENGG